MGLLILLICTAIGALCGHPVIGLVVGAILLAIGSGSTR